MFNDNSSFYREAYHTIYNWLTEEEKLNFNIENLLEGLENNEISEQHRFFKILHFIEVNYVSVEEYTNEMLNNFSKIKDDKQQNNINDIFLQNENQTSISNLKNIFEKEKIKEKFKKMIKDMTIEYEYESYLISLKRVRKNDEKSQY